MTMKRLPSASTIRYQLHRLFVTVLLAVAALALLGKAAHAQESCGGVGDQPEAVLDDMVDVLGLYFPIEDVRTCEKIAKAGVAGCHKAVSDTQSCLGSLIKSTRKAVKSACEPTVDPATCYGEAKGAAEGAEAAIEEDAEDAHLVCDTEFPNSLLGTCLGIP
jgi:hypothetical protein